MSIAYAHAFCSVFLQWQEELLDNLNLLCFHYGEVKALVAGIFSVAVVSNKDN